MGNCLASIFRRSNVRRHIVLLLIGLDNAGKTKTVNNLAGEKDEPVLPTVGFKAVNLVHKDTPVTIYDLGGSPNFRQIWSQYYSEVHGVIFVIDSSDFSRLDECKAVLEEVLSHDKVAGKPVLVLANKQDKQGALDDIDVVEKLNIEPLVNKYRCPTLVESYSASVSTQPAKRVKLDPGLKKGYQWLLNYIYRRYGDINLRVQTDIHADLERRTRLLNRASNRASQTFTAVSDEITTQTGFENPNFRTLSRNTTDAKEKDLGSNLIIVKPVSHVSNSLDTTVTIESADDSVASLAKPKLSPLFGRASEASAPGKVELEPRGEFRKLSPIVRAKGAGRHIDFQHRPQSSPTFKKGELNQSSCTHDSFGAANLTAGLGEDSYGAANVTAGLGDSWEGARGRTVLLDEVEMSARHREILFAERSEPNTRGAMSDVTPGGRALKLPPPPAAPGPRPASASQLLRRQLELTPLQHKRRLSLRYVHRNKTSPERAGAFRYEPKAPRRHLDNGDFERANYLAQDVHL